MSLNTAGLHPAFSHTAQHTKAPHSAEASTEAECMGMALSVWGWHWRFTLEYARTERETRRLHRHRRRPCTAVPYTSVRFYARMPARVACEPHLRRVVLAQRCNLLAARAEYGLRTHRVRKLKKNRV